MALVDVSAHKIDLGEIGGEDYRRRQIGDGLFGLALRLLKASLEVVANGVVGGFVDVLANGFQGLFRAAKLIETARLLQQMAYVGGVHQNGLLDAVQRLVVIAQVAVACSQPIHNLILGSQLVGSLKSLDGRVVVPTVLIDAALQIRPQVVVLVLGLLYAQLGNQDVPAYRLEFGKQSVCILVAVQVDGLDHVVGSLTVFSQPKVRLSPVGIARVVGGIQSDGIAEKIHSLLIFPPFIGVAPLALVAQTVAWIRLYHAVVVGFGQIVLRLAIIVFGAVVERGAVVGIRLE